MKNKYMNDERIWVSTSDIFFEYFCNKSVIVGLVFVMMIHTRYIKYQELKINILQFYWA